MLRVTLTICMEASVMVVLVIVLQDMLWSERESSKDDDTSIRRSLYRGHNCYIHNAMYTRQVQAHGLTREGQCKSLRKGEGSSASVKDRLTWHC